MLFSSLTFLYYFLPALLVLYFIAPKGLKNIVLLIFSLLFYFWGEPVYTLLMLVSTLAAYLLGLVIDKYRGKRLSKAAMWATVIIECGLLMLFKYSDFFIESIAGALSLSVKGLGLTLPIGISFYTFQILSYTLDLYKGKTQVQRNPLNFATYVTLFPQLVAGPIVRYSDVASSLDKRNHSIEGFSRGAFRFTLGLAKKVLIANALGELCEIYKQSENAGTAFAWIYIIAYSLHIYFDFSGYSDMAIGLGRIFGFDFPENFNYPYTSKSITEFWRRWHMTLSSWFRDYVYIPIGGNRVSKSHHIFNILLVWLLTGLWHGAAWNFVLWGLYFGVFLLAEKYVLSRLLEKLPSFFRHIYSLFIIILGWVLFDSVSISDALHTTANLFGLSGTTFAAGNVCYYFRSYAVLLIVAIVGCTPLPRKCVERIEKSKASAVLSFAEPLAAAAMLITVTAFLVDGSFNPFIYFRF